MNKRKVVIIGDGMVGSSIAYSLLINSAAKNIVIIDLLKEKAEGDALDMNHAMSLYTPKDIKAGDYEDISDAHIIIITAGANQKPGETRIDLLNKNEKILDGIFENMRPYLNKDSIILMVTNPVDILTHYTYTNLGLPAKQVIGSGTVLDSARLRYLLSKDTGIDPRNIHAYVIGEHGDSELMAYSITSIGGVPIYDFCTKCLTHKGKTFSPTRLKEIEKDVINSAYTIIDKKGSTYYGIAAAVVRIVDSIINDTNSILTISSYIESAFDGRIQDVYLSVPSIVTSKGVKQTIWPIYSKDEKEALIASADKIKSLIKK